MIWHDGCGPRLVRYDTDDGDSDADTNLWLVLDQTQKGRVTRAELRQARASLARRYLHRCRIARRNTTTPTTCFQLQSISTDSILQLIYKSMKELCTHRVSHIWQTYLLAKGHAGSVLCSQATRAAEMKSPQLLPSWATEHTQEYYIIPVTAHTYSCI